MHAEESLPQRKSGTLPGDLCPSLLVQEPLLHQGSSLSSRVTEKPRPLSICLEWRWEGPLGAPESCWLPGDPGFPPLSSRGADAEGEWQSRMQAALIRTLRWSQGKAGFPAASPTSATSSFLPGTPASPAPWPSLSHLQVSAATQSQQGGPNSEAWPLWMWTTHLRPSGLSWLRAWAPLSASAQSPLHCSPCCFWPRLPALLRKEVPFRLLFPSCWDLAQAC